jgi:DNA repair protein RadC
MPYELQIVQKPLEVRETGPKITSPIEISQMLDSIRNEVQEHFVCITMDSGGNVITRRVITIGLLNHSLVHPREVFRGAIMDSAASIIIAHNHPSGSLEPSSQDISITTQLKEAGQIVGIQVIDHIIVSKNGFLSFRERGLM